MFNAPAAFAPFFDQQVGVTGERRTPAGGVRRVGGTYRACVMDAGFNDPFSEEATASNVRQVIVYIPRCGAGSWDDETPPQRGDSITLAGGAKFNVMRVDADDMLFTIDAREVAAA